MAKGLYDGIIKQGELYKIPKERRAEFTKLVCGHGSSAEFLDWLASDPEACAVLDTVLNRLSRRLQEWDHYDYSSRGEQCNRPSSLSKAVHLVLTFVIVSVGIFTGITLGHLLKLWLSGIN